MKGLKFTLAAALICCSVWLASCDIQQVNDTPGAVSIPSDGSQYIPTAGDVIRCENSSDYIILDAGIYPDSGPLPSAPKEWPEDRVPEGEALRYKDGSGDYLFLRNRFETLRMAYTLCNWETGIGPDDVQLSIPGDVVSDAFSSWEPGQLAALDCAERDSIFCVEAWDMFKNGVYYRTVYQIGVQPGEVRDE